MPSPKQMAGGRLCDDLLCTEVLLVVWAFTATHKPLRVSTSFPLLDTSLSVGAVARLGHNSNLFESNQFTLPKFESIQLMIHVTSPEIESVQLMTQSGFRRK